jgi:hypothetical protein
VPCRFSSGILRTPRFAYDRVNDDADGNCVT